MRIQKIVNMDRTFNERWSDFLNRYGTFYCPFCKDQKLNFSNPKPGNVAGIDVVAVSCLKCGHIELFDIEEVERIAKEVDQDFRDKGWR